MRKVLQLNGRKMELDWTGLQQIPTAAKADIAPNNPRYELTHARILAASVRRQSSAWFAPKFCVLGGELLTLQRHGALVDSGTIPVHAPSTLCASRAMDVTVSCLEAFATGQPHDRGLRFTGQ